MPESLLTILKFCFLALLYLFFLRVLRAVWAEVSPARSAPAAPAPARGRRERAGVGTRGAPAKLKVVEPTEAAGRTYDLADEVTVGRAPGCQVAIDDTYASQLHARIFRKDGQLYVEDLGSTNGTYLNRRKVSGPMVMRKGDRVQVGKTVLEVR